METGPVSAARRLVTADPSVRISYSWTRTRADAHARTRGARPPSFGERPCSVMKRIWSPISGVEALTLVTQMTNEAWSLSGRALPTYTRASIPYRFVPGRLT